jgi:hypothetical protein
MNIKKEDYNESTGTLVKALSLVGLTVDYPVLELVLDIKKHLKQNDGDISLTEAASIRLKHEKKWEPYFKEQQNGGKQEATS